MALLADTKTARDNLAQFEDLQREKLQLESRVKAWMGKATNLYGVVDDGDHQTVLDERDDLIARLTAAVQISGA